MSNKRITELIPMPPATLASDDLFAIADVSIPETKKITTSDLASWIGASASLSINSASYSDTASFLVFRGMGANSNGTASFAISSSWAHLAYSASFVISASHVITASYCLSGCLTSSYASGAIHCETASYLLYQGFPNGTSSYSISSSRALFSNTSSYIQWFGGQVDNGTIYNAISSSVAKSASFFVNVSGTQPFTSSWSVNSRTASLLSFVSDFGPTSNGTSSHARYAYSASNAAAVSNVTNTNIFREWGPLTSSIIGTDYIANTASFGYFQVTGSGAKIIVEAWGDVRVTQSSDINYSGSLRLDLSESVSAYYALDTAKFQNYSSGSDGSILSQTNTGSMVCRFYMKGYTTNAGALGGMHRYNLGLYADNGISFITGSNDWSGVRCSFKVNTDNVVDE